ncbi:Eco57I restriction-modification methylase domain-containing protein [Mycoplasmopsis lipophila]|uniref:Eco57I restriction-modification methylase domain-containing protein n=1 Tax=Mycoplasmopsis lipophila TaxID=2117 RepID=UPI003872D529
MNTKNNSINENISFKFEIKKNNLNKKQEIFDFFDSLNNDLTHKNSKDDECTPMKCVEQMIDYIPEEFWNKNNLKILDPCSGNGNFGAYCSFKTDLKNIWFNELNTIRYENCKKILNPTHINNEDFFNMTGDFNNTKFDLIMANPPYSGGGNKNKSLSNKFIEKSIDLLNDQGYLCFITPNNWMSYNNNNTTLKKLLYNGSFLVIDNNAKKFFPKIGSSFSIFVWQKTKEKIETIVKNKYCIEDTQKVFIEKDTPFIPLYISNETLSISKKMVNIKLKNNLIKYRCDLHNFTKSKYLSDKQDEKFKFLTIHTARKNRYSTFKQDIYEKNKIIIPLSTYFLPYLVKKSNVTQSVAYICIDDNQKQNKLLKKLREAKYKVLIHLTRYGNFNNLKILKNMVLNDIKLNEKEKETINKIANTIKY